MEGVLITADDLARRLAGLDGIGVGADGAVTRLAWTPEDAACRAWFADQAAALGREVLTDPAGNLWAVPDADRPLFAPSSEDSVNVIGPPTGAENCRSICGPGLGYLPAANSSRMRLKLSAVRSS